MSKENYIFFSPLSCTVPNIKLRISLYVLYAQSDPSCAYNHENINAIESAEKNEKFSADKFLR